MDLAFPVQTILSKSDIKHLRLIEHLMVETQDTLVFDVRGLRRLGWRHDEVFEMILMRSRGLAVSKSTHRLGVRIGRLLKMR